MMLSDTKGPLLVVPKPGSNDPSIYEQVVHYVDSNYAAHLSEDDRMGVMKQLWHLSESKAPALADRRDDLVSFLIRRVEASFSEKDGIMTINHQLCRYALNTLLELFKFDAVAVGVKQASVPV